MQQRYFREIGDPSIGGDMLRGTWRTNRHSQLVHRRSYRVVMWVDHEQAESWRKGEKIANGDRPVGGNGVVDRPVEALEHLPIGELGKEAIDRLIEAELAFLDQDHRGSGGDWLRHRGDAKDGVARHRLAIDRSPPDHVNFRLAAPADEGDQSGDRAMLDVARHQIMHAI